MPIKLATPYRTQPFKHQLEGIEALCKHPAFALLDEMGAGKSKQVIDAACTLAQAGKIDTVVVVCPASVRGVWCDAENGEIAKHCWLPTWVAEYHVPKKVLRNDPESKLAWLVTNYELLRRDEHLIDLCKHLKDRSVLLVLDESSYIKSRTAAQTKAIMRLRVHCRRCVILNGTPITNNPLDLFSQMQVLNPKILGSSYWAFRAKYAEMVPQKFGHGPTFQKIVGYKNLDELQWRIAPYCLRRLKKNCLDLPEKLYTTREVALTPESWKRYQQLKREAVIALGKDELRLEPNAAVRIMRLAQLTSGHLGKGAECIQESHLLTDDAAKILGVKFVNSTSDDVSSEKLDWTVQYLTEECTARYVIVWCRWRRERERLFAALAEKLWVGQLYGGQPKREREDNVKEFSTPLMGADRKVLLAQPHAGGLGLNLVAATEVLYLSNDYSWGTRIQSEDRCHRPGQKHNVTYLDVLATGPKGERSIDHIILKALRDKQNIAEWTASAWRKELVND